MMRFLPELSLSTPCVMGNQVQQMSGNPLFSSRKGAMTSYIWLEGQDIEIAFLVLRAKGGPRVRIVK